MKDPTLDHTVIISHGRDACCLGSNGLDHPVVSSGAVCQDFSPVAELGKLLLSLLINSA